MNRLNRQRGGENRTHGSTEDVSRIDSFYWINRDYAKNVAEEMGNPDPALYIEGCNVHVAWARNTYDKPDQRTRMYWLCPVCMRRVRYLYCLGGKLLCRRCAQLNYPCQQQTKNTEAEARNMRNALCEMGCGNLARKTIDELLEMPPPAFPDGWDEKSFARGWRRFCKARERYCTHLIRSLMRYI